MLYLAFPPVDVPELAVPAVALLTVFGAPAVLVRIGLIGSVSFETGAASIAAGTMGADLGGPTYTQGVFAVAFMAMSLGGAMWMLATLVLTPLLKKGDVSLRKVNPAVMTVVPGAALLGSITAETVLDATGKYVIPGGVDAHTHMEMPFGGTESSDTFETGTVAAAWGGITTIVDFAVQNTGGSVQDALGRWHEKAAGNCAIDYAFHQIIGGVDEESLNKVRAFKKEQKAKAKSQA